MQARARAALPTRVLSLPVIPGGDRAELRAFLMACRARLRPEDLSLPRGPRRRTAGLRREEVATLSGLSSTWYTWLEQGRGIRISEPMLAAVARALRLTGDERSYLYSLALDDPHRRRGREAGLPAVTLGPRTGKGRSDRARDRCRAREGRRRIPTVWTRQTVAGRHPGTKRLSLR